ncbi:hypothetical protein EJ110_NYTH42640 [Nymphaea thermarum]|nr:hypothetical protein EJ110_NYTH42640 [Nymphaea thermarum]
MSVSLFLFVCHYRSELKETIFFETIKPCDSNQHPQDRGDAHDLASGIIIIKVVFWPRWYNASQVEGTTDMKRTFAGLLKSRSYELPDPLQL